MDGEELLKAKIIRSSGGADAEKEHVKSAIGQARAEQSRRKHQEQKGPGYGP
jgi:hypothetical protein